MTQQRWKYLAAFVAGGFLFAPAWTAIKRLLGRA